MMKSSREMRAERVQRPELDEGFAAASKERVSEAIGDDPLEASRIRKGERCREQEGKRAEVRAARESGSPGGVSARLCSPKSRVHLGQSAPVPASYETVSRVSELINGVMEVNTREVAVKQQGLHSSFAAIPHAQTT